MVWERRDDGMWIALIRFNRQVEARLEKQPFLATPLIAPAVP